MGSWPQAPSDDTIDTDLEILSGYLSLEYVTNLVHSYSKDPRCCPPATRDTALAVGSGHG